MPEKAKSKEQRQQARTPDLSKKQRPWRTPVFSTLKVNATQQLTSTGDSHCWGHWKCS